MWGCFLTHAPCFQVIFDILVFTNLCLSSMSLWLYILDSCKLFTSTVCCASPHSNSILYIKMTKQLIILFLFLLSLALPKQRAGQETSLEAGTDCTLLLLLSLLAVFPKYCVSAFIFLRWKALFYLLVPYPKLVQYLCYPSLYLP